MNGGRSTRRSGASAVIPPSTTRRGTKVFFLLTVKNMSVLMLENVLRNIRVILPTVLVWCLMNHSLHELVVSAIYQSLLVRSKNCTLQRAVQNDEEEIIGPNDSVSYLNFLLTDALLKPVKSYVG